MLAENFLSHSRISLFITLERSAFYEETLSIYGAAMPAGLPVTALRRGSGTK
jgi:hypothetical protein